MILRATIIALVGAGAVWATTEPQPQKGAKKESAAKEGAIDPRADLILKRMCSYLGGLKSMRADATTIDEKVTTDGHKIQELKESHLEMQRPNQLAIDRTGPNGRALLRYDGKQITIYGVHQNLYATAPAPATLEATIDEARDRYGLDAPASDLFAADAYHELLDGVSEARYLGLEPVHGVLAHHLAMRKGKVDYQLWIQDGAEPIPLRYVITSRDLPGQPQFTLELHELVPNPPLSESSFTFVPPPGAQKVTLSDRAHM